MNRPGSAGGSIPLDGWSHGTQFSLEVRERAVRMVFEHGSEYGSQWEAIRSIASKIGCSPETLRKGARQTEVDSGRRGGLTSDEQARIQELE